MVFRLDLQLSFSGAAFVSSLHITIKSVHHVSILYITNLPFVISVSETTAKLNLHLHNEIFYNLQRVFNAMK